MWKHHEVIRKFCWIQVQRFYETKDRNTRAFLRQSSNGRWFVWCTNNKSNWQVWNAKTR